MDTTNTTSAAVLKDRMEELLRDIEQATNSFVRDASSAVSDIKTSIAKTDGHLNDLENDVDAFKRENVQDINRLTADLADIQALIKKE